MKSMKSQKDTEKKVETTESHVRGRKDIVGTVVSVKMNKTVIVEMVHMFRHPLYRKAVKKTKHTAAHYEDMELSLGDTVKLLETKPISKTKHFRVIEKVTR